MANTVNINGHDIDLDELGVAVVEVEQDLEMILRTIVDAIGCRTAYAIDHNEPAQVIARLAIASHFIMHSLEEIDKQSGDDMPTPGARGMQS